MTKLEKLQAEKNELLGYREFLVSLDKDKTISENTQIKDKPKVKKLGVWPRNNKEYN